LPPSICATMDKLRIFAIGEAVLGRLPREIGSERAFRDRCGWVNGA
jgi:hypothetical protein